MRLYEDPLAPNCRHVRVFLEEKGVEVDNFRNRFPPFAERGLPGTRGVPQIRELIDRGRHSVLRFYGHLDQRLARFPYLAGDFLSSADICAMCAIDFALFCEIDIPKMHGTQQTWCDSMEARDSAKARPGLVSLLGSALTKAVGGRGVCHAIKALSRRVTHATLVALCALVSLQGGGAAR